MRKAYKEIRTCSQAGGCERWESPGSHIRYAVRREGDRTSRASRSLLFLECRAEKKEEERLSDSRTHPPSFFPQVVIWTVVSRLSIVLLRQSTSRNNRWINALFITGLNVCFFLGSGEECNFPHLLSLFRRHLI